MSRVPHDPELCGLEIDGRPVCRACLDALHNEQAACVVAERRRRRRDAIRGALPLVVRRWLRRLVGREVYLILARELPGAVAYLTRRAAP
jgi:hypothetical protein